MYHTKIMYLLSVSVFQGVHCSCFGVEGWDLSEIDSNVTGLFYFSMR